MSKFFRISLSVLAAGMLSFQASCSDDKVVDEQNPPITDPSPDPDPIPDTTPSIRVKDEVKELSTVLINGKSPELQVQLEVSVPAGFSKLVVSSDQSPLPLAELNRDSDAFLKLTDNHPEATQFIYTFSYAPGTEKVVKRELLTFTLTDAKAQTAQVPLTIKILARYYNEVVLGNLSIGETSNAFLEANAAIALPFAKVNENVDLQSAVDFFYYSGKNVKDQEMSTLLSPSEAEGLIPTPLWLGEKNKTLFRSFTLVNQDELLALALKVQGNQLEIDTALASLWESANPDTEASYMILTNPKEALYILFKVAADSDGVVQTGAFALVPGLFDPNGITLTNFAITQL